jgi:hypothetical protein
MFHMQTMPTDRHVGAYMRQREKRWKGRKKSKDIHKRL